jgi:hypothetical protein
MSAEGPQNVNRGLSASQHVQVLKNKKPALTNINCVLHCYHCLPDRMACGQFSKEPCRFSFLYFLQEQSSDVTR